MPVTPSPSLRRTWSSKAAFCSGEDYVHPPSIARETSPPSSDAAYGLVGLSQKYRLRACCAENDEDPAYYIKQQKKYKSDALMHIRLYSISESDEDNSSDDNSDASFDTSDSEKMSGNEQNGEIAKKKKKKEKKVHTASNTFLAYMVRKMVWTPITKLRKMKGVNE